MFGLEKTRKLKKRELKLTVVTAYCCRKNPHLPHRRRGGCPRKHMDEHFMVRLGH